MSSHNSNTRFFGWVGPDGQPFTFLYQHGPSATAEMTCNLLGRANTERYYKQPLTIAPDIPRPNTKQIKRWAIDNGYRLAAFAFSEVSVQNDEAV